jgi:hypothetical protein
VELMGTARYAFRVRAGTATRSWLAGQAALSGMLARIRLLGLELLEVRRL